MKRVMTTELISSLLILLFVYTGLSKLLSIEHFQAVLGQSPLISSGAGLLAWQVPLTELAMALLLFFSSTRLVGLWAALVLLALFTMYLGWMVLFSPHLPGGQKFKKNPNAPLDFSGQRTGGEALQSA